jgi:hypothetical protein
MRLIPTLVFLCGAWSHASHAAPAAAAPAIPEEVLDTTESGPAASRPDAVPPAAPNPAATPAASAASPSAAAPSPAASPSAAPEATPVPAAASAVSDSASGASEAPVSGTRGADSAPPAGALFLRNPLLERLDLSGTVQLKAFYRDFASNRDAEKRLSLQLRRFQLGLDGAVSQHAGFRGVFLLDGADKSFGAEDAFLWWTCGEWFGLKGGKVKRPFSQEALQSSRALYTVERGELYHAFLADTTGYAYYDLGLAAYGGFAAGGVSVAYELGVFNGKQSANGYAGQQNERTDAGFFAKDMAARLTISPFPALKVEAAVSTKAADDRSDPGSFGFAMNTAYELGADLALGPFRFLGEVALGDDHHGTDSLIVAGAPRFFAFYATGVWREEYRGGRASELVLKLEGLDPDFGWKTGDGRENDGKLRYTAGCNYFFSPAVSVLADYSVLQPVTLAPGQDRLIHSLDVMWRVGF